MASDPEREAEVEEAEEVDRASEDAFGEALRALGRRERSIAEMRTWLAAREVPARAAEQAVERLCEVGALDDRRFAVAFAEDKRTLAGWGSERIEAALRARGVPEEAIAEALAADDGAAELERATALLGERGESLESDAARQRALGFLVRRGYQLELAYEAIRVRARGEAA